MSTLKLPGLATGIDTSKLVEQLMAINSRRLATYKVKKSEYDDQSSALDDLRSRVTALRTAVNALSDADSLETFITSSSDSDILTVSASTEASPGSHSVEINRLAAGETWIQDTSTFSYKTDYVGGGDFIYSYNNQERVITAIDNDTTLDDFVTLINNDEDNPGVTASLLYHDGKYHLMLSGNQTGEDYQIFINASSTEVWAGDLALTQASDGENAVLTMKITELTQFGANSLEGGEVIEITGADRYGNAITQMDLSLTANTTVGHLVEEIENAFDGNVRVTVEEGKIIVTDKASGASSLSVTLTYNANGSAATLTLPTMAVSAEGGNTSESLASLLSTSFIQTQQAQNSQTKVDGYPSAAAVSEFQELAHTPKANSGHFHLTYGGETTGEIAYDATPGEIQTALETLSSVNAGDITVSGDPLDAVGTLTFEFSDTMGDVGMILIDSSALDQTYVVTEQTKGVSSWISRNSNSVTDALMGVTLHLQDVTTVAAGGSGDPIGITLRRNTSAVSSKVQAMVNTYNELMEFLAEKTEYDPETKKMGILSSDFSALFTKSGLRDPFNGLVTGFTSQVDSFVQASDIGITLNGDGKLELDSSKLNDAIDEDFVGVIDLLGAAGTGNSDSSAVEFYSASEKYTTAGTYDVKVVVVSNGQGGFEIQSAYIKLSSESTYRSTTWNGSIITGDSSFETDGSGPKYAENGLQLKVDLSQAGTYGTDADPVVVRVKRGFAGTLKNMLDEVLEVGGRIDISEDILDDKTKQIDLTIEREQDRLDQEEERLVEKFARMEKTLTLLQQQMGAAGILSTGYNTSGT